MILSNKIYFETLLEIPIELKQYSPYMKKARELLVNQSSKDASNTLNHTTLTTPFPQTSPGGTPA